MAEGGVVRRREKDVLVQTKRNNDFVRNQADGAFVRMECVVATYCKNVARTQFLNVKSCQGRCETWAEGAAAAAAAL